jgi:hypothetical protein
LWNGDRRVKDIVKGGEDDFFALCREERYLYLHVKLCKLVYEPIRGVEGDASTRLRIVLVVALPGVEESCDAAHAARLRRQFLVVLLFVIWFLVTFFV